jgi:hypothetical protein
LQQAPAVCGHTTAVGGRHDPPAVHTNSGGGQTVCVVWLHSPVIRLQHAPVCRHGGIWLHVWLL